MPESVSPVRLRTKPLIQFCRAPLGCLKA